MYVLLEDPRRIERCDDPVYALVDRLQVTRAARCARAGSSVSFCWVSRGVRRRRKAGLSEMSASL